MDRETLDKLEALVEAYGIAGVVSGLSYLCSEKSLHINAHWPSMADVAKDWMQYATALDRVGANMEDAEAA